MENPRFIKFLVITSVFLLLAIPSFLFAYDDKTTHPALTQEIVKFFNQSFPQKQLTDEEKELVIKGSIDEDAFGRWMRHYYDPVHNRGLSYLGATWQSSKEWNGDTIAQATYKIQSLPERTLYGSIKDLFSGETDYSWERGIYEYAWGDKKRGLETLGHILHLIEDAAVPDHTRNDPHPGFGSVLKEKMPAVVPEFLFSLLDHHNTTDASPYESWTAKFNRTSIDILLPQEKPIAMESISDYFDAMARYSNNNFFSKDTILTSPYSLPEIGEKRIEKLSDGEPYMFGYSISQENSFRLVLIKGENKWSNPIFVLDDPDKLILGDYWSHLSKQAVLHGAGVIKLFFDEVEKEKNTKALYDKNRSWLGRKIDNFQHRVLGIAGALYGTSVTQSDLGDTPAAIVDDSSQNPVAQDASLPDALQAPEKEKAPAADIEAPKRAPPLQDPAPIPLSPSPAPAPRRSSDTSPSLPLAGVGGPRLPLQEASSPSDDSSSAPSGASSVTSPPASPAAPPPPPPDTDAPALSSLDIQECGQSLSITGCLVTTAALTLSWTSSSTDLSYYTLTCRVAGVACANFSYASTTATSTHYTLPDNNTVYTFSITATDTSGNTSVEKTKTVTLATRPVVINEISWAGTSAARAEDEWLELYNPTDQDISLSGWVLRSATDNTPYITLSGTIAHKGFFLLERTNDTTISDIAADKIYTGGLGNNGEALELSRASTTIDATPSVGTCGGFWCRGDNSGAYPSMERYDPLASGAGAANWGSASGVPKNGKNADGAAVSGTPGKRNSVNYLIALSGSSLIQNKTLTKEYTPYIIPDVTLIVQSGVTLAINPGVVIKFHSVNSALLVQGAIRAEGTAADPVVFTSFHDDDCGIPGGCGDTDATTTAPAAGDWGSMKISASATDSLLDHTLIRYGGVDDPSFIHYTNLRIENASTTLSNSVIEKSKTYGVYVKNAAGGTIASNIIRNNAFVGLFVSSSSPAILSNQFAQNDQGLFLHAQTSSTVTANIFTQNIHEAVLAVGAYPIFSGNTASGNGINAISFQGTLAKNYSFSTDLPYVIGSSVLVPVGTALTIPPGGVVKFASNSSGLTIDGQLIAQGTPDAKIIFTSVRDDTYGGDTNGDGAASTPIAGDWNNIYFHQSTATSTLAHAIVRYGGNTIILNPDNGALRVEDTSIAISDTTIEKNYRIGLWLKNSASTTITDSLIQHHRDPVSNESYGIFLVSSSPAIKNTLFKDNGTAIFGSGVSSVINLDGITFEGNAVDDTPTTLIP